MAEAAALTLADICLDVQISICMYLHPSDISALRKTCKALQPCTQQRVVWEAALHRVCIDNAIFLPSFPISDMSDLEIEKAAMGPRRWIELCGAFEKRHLNDPGVILSPRSTRIISDSFDTEVDYDNTQFFIVPGGRYIVSSSSDGISVLDLGYTSSADCKLIASVELEGGSNTCLVQATPDGMGLIIFSHTFEDCVVYEIYPQSETPHLTKIAHLDFDFTMELYLLPEKVIWFDIDDDKIVFRIWNYRLALNHSISFSVHLNMDKFLILKVMATETAIIVLCQRVILIWAIPTLSPQLDSSFFDDNPTHDHPPLFTIPFPYGIVSKCIECTTISSWYFGFSQPLYFEMIYQDSKHRWFQIILKPDLSTASLRVINTFGPTPHFKYATFQDFRICDDTIVSCWIYEDRRQKQYECVVYTGFTSGRFANVISHGGPAAKMLLPKIRREYRIFPCPTSGRFVRLDSSNSVAVLDFF